MWWTCGHSFWILRFDVANAKASAVVFATSENWQIINNCSFVVLSCQKLLEKCSHIWRLLLVTNLDIFMSRLSSSFRVSAVNLYPIIFPWKWRRAGSEYCFDRNFSMFGYYHLSVTSNSVAVWWYFFTLLHLNNYLDFEIFFDSSLLKEAFGLDDW